MRAFIKRVLPFFMMFSASALAISDLDYLPKQVSYDPAIPLPSDVLGAPVGEWHVRHDQLVQYMRLLDAKSDRVSLVETGRTHENRTLLLLAFSSATNQKNLGEIQKSHLATVKSGKKANSDDPLVLWMGYSVHGDEASGSNAALLIAYYLAAAQGEQIDNLLENNVVLLDPSINPDGLSRFAQWANMHKSKNLVSDPNNREHIQGWPSGRTNHYWFDLNRDWLLLTHPESRARIKQFHQWRPHVLTDFHEMGPNSTYFFQPGIASRKNPWTPDRNVELTEALGKFHAAALDADKQLYFTQEGFDDFYYGKGSTYPDAHGSVGILFEQASSRGHLQDTINGPRSFADAIQNQVTTSLSTFAGSLENKQGLLDFQTEFVKQTAQLIKDDEITGYILSESHDKTRFAHLQNILKQHQIIFKPLSKEVEIDDKTFEPSSSVFVPLDQPQYRLIKSIFSVRKRFNDNTFYDVSNWNLALAFNIDYAAVYRGLWRKTPVSNDGVKATTKLQQKLTIDAYAYGFSWRDYNSPKLLQNLLADKVQVRVAGKAFVAGTTQGQIDMEPGSIVIPNNDQQPDNLAALVSKHANELNITIWPIQTGLTQQGIDLGSSNMRPMTQPKVLIVGGRGTSQYEVGEAWHYLDNHVGMPVSIIELARIGSTDLSDYTHMIWVSGSYAKVPEMVTRKISQWLKSGGVLIGQKSAAKWFSDKEWLKANFIKDDDIEEAFSKKDLNFADKEALEAKQRIAGASYATRLDITHPLGFGFTRTLMPVFRNHDLIMQVPDKPFVTAAQYNRDPLMAGYTSDELQKLIGGSAAVVAHTVGSGRVIAFSDNPNFRGYWYGTSRLLSNAIFMSAFINAKG